MRLKVGQKYRDTKILEIDNINKLLTIECRCGAIDTIKTATYHTRKWGKKYSGCRKCMDLHIATKIKAPHCVSRLYVGRNICGMRIIHIENKEPRSTSVAKLLCDCGVKATRTLGTLSGYVKNGKQSICECRQEKDGGKK